MAQCTNDSVSLEKKKRQLNKNTPNEKIYDVSQSDVSINENTTANSFNNGIATVQGPMGDNNEIKLWKAWTMEMPLNDGDILMTVVFGIEQERGDYKKFLYVRATNSDHVIQYHMQQIMGCQKIVKINVKRN